jgi:predicted dehydrogenase
MIRDFLGVENLEIVAICDNVAKNAADGRALIEKAGRKAPELYTDGDRAYEKMVMRDDLDFIYIATPWEWHAPQAIAAMKAGKQVGVEVPLATTMADLWKIVETSEQTRKHCIMLENCCFNYNEMLVLNMVRDGVFGSLTHAEAAYIHDLREIVNENRSEGLWRRAWHTRVNGNLYPTHGLGPVANYLDINRGDRFEYLVSMSSPSRALDEYREKTVVKTSPKWREKYLCGDMNTSLIKTAKGISIMLQHDVSTPRPYTRLNHIQGTKGTFCDFPARLYLDGQAGGHRWTDLAKMRDKYEHWLWKKLGEKARGAGHGGMDFVMSWRIVQYFNDGLVPDIDVYDGAAWSAPFPMSAESVAKGSVPVKFPDFTRGKWNQPRPTLA